MSSAGSMLAFHHLTIAVKDVPAAIADWENLLGWSARPATAQFGLDEGYLELVAAPEGRTGVVAVAVVVDDVAALADRIEAAGGQVDRRDDGIIAIDRASINGVPLELYPSSAASTSAATGPFRRINHLVIAVADYEATVARWTAYFGEWPKESNATGEVSEHVPVGAAWFGLTAAGSNAEALERFIARSGDGVYAVGLITGDRRGTLTGLRSRGARLLGDETTPQTFIHPATTHGLLVDVLPERASSATHSANA
jgi:catechol 2,3-dioxygenase-like lactoylglutathione lyase family enzyme